MKQKTRKKASGPVRRAPTDDEISDYAYHLYQQSGCLPGHDLDNWLEAKACLEASIPKHQARLRLHRHQHHPAPDAIALLTIATAESSSGPDDPGGGSMVVEDVLLR